MRAAQGVGHQSRLGVCGGGNAHRDRPVALLVRTPLQQPPAAARQTRGHAADRVRDGRRAPQGPIQFDRWTFAVQQERRVGTAEAEHGLVGVAGEHRQLRPLGE